jgi:hypothetical protein
MSWDFNAEIIDRLMVEWLKTKLTPMEWDIFYLKKAEGYTFAEIGIVVGEKYRGRLLTGSTMRYYMDNKIMPKLEDYREFM